jgi:protein-S-isoprenylcysteine O-methyltransferase Ste14
VRILGRAWSDWVGLAWYLGSAIWLLTGIGTTGPAILLPVVLELAVAAVFMIRGPARRANRTWPARIVAYTATFLVPVVVRVAPGWVDPTPVPLARTIGATLWIGGAVLMLWPLWYLRRAFGIEAAARELVVRGPYRFSRHPMYVCYALNYTGLCLLRFTPLMVATTIVWYVTMVVRAHIEERVLGEAFSEYDDYTRRVGRFVTGWRAFAPALDTGSANPEPRTTTAADSAASQSSGLHPGTPRGGSVLPGAGAR